LEAGEDAVSEARSWARCVRDLVEAGDRFRPRGSGEVHVVA
jgi:hypothetical protein